MEEIRGVQEWMWVKINLGTSMDMSCKVAAVNMILYTVVIFFFLWPVASS